MADTATGHAYRKHAILGPSSSDRWLNCPGSVRYTIDMPDTSSVYADEGTAAHTLAAHCLQKGFNAGDFAGWKINVDGEDYLSTFYRPSAPIEGEKVFVVDDEMVDGVQLYLDTCRDYLGNPGPGEMVVEIVCEERVYVSEDPVINGTVDWGLYWPEIGRLVAVDFKYGRGKKVEAKDNSQGVSYTLGLINRFHNRGVKDVEIVIVQPRAMHPDGPVRRWFPTTDELMDWEWDLRNGGKIAEGPDAPFAAGEWCKFCKAKPVCPTRAAASHEIAMAQFEDLSGAPADPTRPDAIMSLPEIPSLPPEVIARTLERIEELQDWCKGVIAYAHSQAEQGREIPGWKLVDKRATRKWVEDEETTATALELFGLTEDDIYLPRKLKSPAQVEPKLPGSNKQKRAACLTTLAKALSSGTVLAPEKDKRESVKKSPEGQFEDLTQEVEREEKSNS